MYPDPDMKPSSYGSGHRSGKLWILADPDPDPQHCSGSTTSTNVQFLILFGGSCSTGTGIQYIRFKINYQGRISGLFRPLKNRIPSSRIRTFSDLWKNVRLDPEFSDVWRQLWIIFDNIWSFFTLSRSLYCQTRLDNTQIFTTFDFFKLLSELNVSGW
jgi:hypothetical protein